MVFHIKKVTRQSWIIQTKIWVTRVHNFIVWTRILASIIYLSIHFLPFPIFFCGHSKSSSQHTLVFSGPHFHFHWRVIMRELPPSSFPLSWLQTYFISTLIILPSPLILEDDMCFHLPRLSFTSWILDSTLPHPCSSLFHISFNLPPCIQSSIFLLAYF